MYLEKSNDESIYYICTFWSKLNIAVCDMQVLWFWHCIDKVDATTLF